MSQSELTHIDPRDCVPIVTAVMNAIEALVIVLDTEGRIVLFNHRCQKASGYSFEEAKDRYLWELLLAKDLEGVQSALKMFRLGQSPDTHENCWVAKDGNRRRIRWSNATVLDASGVVKYIVGSGIDITEFRTGGSGSWLVFGN